MASAPASIFGIDKGVIAEGKAADLLLYDCADGDPINGFRGLDVSKIQCLLKKEFPFMVTLRSLNHFEYGGAPIREWKCPRGKKRFEAIYIALSEGSRVIFPPSISMGSLSTFIR